MKYIFRFLVLLLLSLPASAAEIVTATITFTNSPADADTITVNANVRTWKTTVATASTEIQRVALAPGSNATNFYNHAVNYPYTGLRATQTGTNVVTLTTSPTTTIAVSFSTAYASVSYSTQAVANLVAVRVPFTAIPDPAATNRAYQANQLLAGMEAYGTNWFRAGASGTAALPIYSFVGDTDSGIYRSAANTFNFASYGTNRLAVGDGYVQWNGYLYGTNGTLGSMILNSPTTTNLVNYGNAISSPGSGTDSEELGTGSQAIGTGSLAVGKAAVAGSTGSVAVGNDAIATNNYSIAIGYDVEATASSSIAIGYLTEASGTASTAVGQESFATAEAASAFGQNATATALQSVAVGAGAAAGHTNAVVLGYGAVASYSGSVAIGASSATTAANQIRMGTASQYVSVPGNLNVAGTVELAKVADLRLPRLDNTSLASGNNSAVSISTNTFVRISSGPGAAFAICGIAGGSDGRVVTIYNATSYNMTIANDSGVDATAANRIYTLTGADYSTTGTGAVTLIYDSGASRWILVSTRD